MGGIAITLFLPLITGPRPLKLPDVELDVRKGYGKFPKVSAEQRCGKGSRSYLLLHPGFDPSGWLLSAGIAFLVDFQIPVLGTSVDRPRACRSVSRPPAAFPPVNSLAGAFREPVLLVSTMRPCAGFPLGPPAGFLARLPAAAPPSSFCPGYSRFLWCRCSGRRSPWTDPVRPRLGLGAGWGGFSQHCRALGP